MTTMVKMGNQDNVNTYKHVCDYPEDLSTIDPQYITLGSTAIVLQGDSGVEVYMSTSDKQWIKLF